MDYLLLHVAGVLIHPLHPLFPPLLHLIGWIENSSLLVPNDTGLIFLHLVEYFILGILPRNLFLQLFHFLLHLPVVPHSNMVLQIKIHLLLILVHQLPYCTTRLGCTLVSLC